MKRVAVIGAGHGGLAVAGHLGMRGHEVRLCDTDPAALAPVAQAGGVEVTGKIAGTGRIALTTTEAAQAARGAELIMIVVPATAHGEVARALAPCVADDQILALHPGGAGGALEFAATFRRQGVTARPIIAEIESFLYGAKTVGPAVSQVGTVKLQDRVAAIPTRATGAVLASLREDFPQFVAATSVLETSLNHMNAMLHVAGMVMNAGWIETSKGDFEFYRDGLSPAVAGIVDEVDRERMAVSDAVGGGATSLRGWIKDTYHVEGPTLFDTIQTLHATVYKTSRAPGTLASRYLAEDVPTGLVPIAALGEAFGVRTPLMRTLIDLTSRIHGVDHWTGGRTLAKMGLEGARREDLPRILGEGAA